MSISARSIEGQDGWSGGTIPVSANIDQAVDQSGVNQRTGTGAWRISNNTSLGGYNGNFAGWVFGPGLSVSAGQPSSGAGADQFTATLWFRSASATADGSNIEIDLGSVAGDDRNTFLAVTNRADADGGLQLRVSEPDGATGNFLPTQVIATGITRSVYHRLDIIANFLDGPRTTPSNTHWMESHSPIPPAAPRSAPSRASATGWSSPYVLSNRLFLRSGAAPSAYGAFVDTAAQGFYLDDLSYSVANQSAPAIPGTESPALAPADEIIYALTPGNVLIRFDSATPSGGDDDRRRHRARRERDHPRHRLPPAHRAALRSGRDHRQRRRQRRVRSYVINPLTGAATLVGRPRPPPGGGGRARRGSTSTPPSIGSGTSTP